LHQNILDRVNNLTNLECNGVDRLCIFQPVPHLCKGFTRLGDQEIGESKNVCKVSDACRSRPCTVLSFGSNGQFEFEEDLLRRGCECDIVVFDCTCEFKSSTSRISSQKFCLDSYSHGDYVDVFSIFSTFSNIRILKVDIEGWEGEIFSDLFSILSNKKQLPYVILLELHIQASFKELSWSYKNKFISSANIRSKRVQGGKSVAEMALLSQIWSAHGYRLLTIEPNAYSQFAAGISLYRAF